MWTINLFFLEITGLSQNVKIKTYLYLKNLCCTAHIFKGILNIYVFLCQRLITTYCLVVISDDKYNTYSLNS